MISEMRAWGRRGRRPSVVREFLVFSRGAIAHIVFDREPEDVLERFQEVLAELRAFISTRARGRIETKTPEYRR